MNRATLESDRPRPSVRETVRQIIALRRQAQQAWEAGDHPGARRAEEQIDELNRAL